MGPIAVNGMTTDPDGGVWVADLFGYQLVRFDPDGGEVLERYGAGDGLCGTDDVTVAPNGDLVATCPREGRVVLVERGGRARTLAGGLNGVNPITLDPSGDAVLVGFGSGDRDELVRIPLDGSAPEVVVDGLPTLNGFDVGPDGLLWVPTGGADGLLGTGGLGAIDLVEGRFYSQELTFDDPSRVGFDFACGTAAADDGTVFVAQCADATLWSVDTATGHATKVGAIASAVGDNVLLLDDGRVLLSLFFGSNIGVFQPLAGGGWSVSQVRVGD